MKNLYFSLLPDAEKAKCKTEKQWLKLGFVPASQDAGTIMYSNRFCTGKYRYLTSEEVRKATDEEMTSYHEEQRRKRRSRYLQAKKEREQAIRYGELLSLCDQQRQLDEENYRGTIPTLTVSIDIETTGLDCYQDEIIQISILDVDTGEVLLDSYERGQPMEHKTKYKQLTEAYLHALGVITESTATWAEFLCSAAYTYEERFQSQVLLHHQRPGVKAVATLNQWDREKNRHIVRGTHGIPVFDAKHPECLTYVFDYQDTAGRSTPGLLPWTVYENKSGIARHNLLRRSGEKSLDSYVHTKVQQIVDTEVKSETSAAMRTELQKFLEQSAKYVVYTRLNMPVDNLDTSAFSFATQYQNRPKVLERLGTLLSHSLVACLSPVRDIAQAMHMTMPPPEGLAVQKKDTRTRSVPETSEVTAEASPEAPREWGFYVIPDLKTWATNSSERTPIEHYETFEEARDRFAALRDQPYNKTNDLNDDGQPYAHLTLGLESKDKLSSVDILQVRAGQNYLVEDFTRMQRLRADSVVLENLSRVAREIGFDRVRPYVMENGSYKALPDMPFSQWENPYFTVDSPEQSDTFTIYQLKGGSETRDYRFEPYESLQEAGLAIDRQNYDLVYTAPLDGKTTLEDIFRTFNLDRPPDFTGHSLSVSDIVVLNRGGDTKAYYCDSAGFVDVPSFLEQKIETAVDQPIINEDEIRRALCDGSGFENGKMRIQYYFSQPVLPPREETIRWLKKEYGTGGRSWDFANGSRGWLDYNNKGFEIQCKTDNGRVSHTLTWQEVSSRLQELVQSNRYLTDAEYPEYEEWLSARQAEQDKRAADLEQAKEIIREYCTENGFDPPKFEDLRHIDLAYSSAGEGEHSINVYVDLLHHKIVYNVDGERILSAQYASTAELVEHELSGVTFDELIGTAEQEYQERKREQAIRSAPQKRPCIPGDIVYLENDKAFIVQDIGEGEILLQDQELPLFSRSVSKEEFSRLLERNERNSRLQAPATPSIETSEKTKESTAPEQVQPQPIPQKTAVEIPINGKWTKFQTVADAEQAAYEEYKANIARNAQNYKALPDEQTEPGGPKARFQDNINALRLLQHLETTGMQATPEQQQLLARYVGWGGLADAFDARKDNWHKEYQELKELLPEAEYEAARASTLTSYYTSPEIVRAMYSTLERFGLQGGNILEPSMGVGAFFANRPASFDESANLFGVELDPVTGRIAKQLYPKANIQICGYEKATLPDSYFDVVIGNVPFGQYKVNDPAFNRYNFLIHDYFAAKSIDKLRVGGIQAIITTSGTMDKQTEDVRKYLAARCELIGAVRLPNTAFKALAGTEVTADILFLQKREHILDQDVSWLHTGTNADGIPMNQYFIDHPEMICGKMEMVSGPYGMRPTCQPDTSTTLEEQLQAAMGRLNATLVKTEPIILEQPGEISPLPADPDIRNYSYGIRDDKIFFRTDSVMREVTANATAQARIRGMVSILATTRELIQAQLDDLPDEAVAQLQRRLNHEYDAFTEKYGRLSSRANALAMREDSGYSLLCSLEIYDDDRNFKAKSDMFTKRTIRPNQVIDHVETASEALMLSVQERTSVDLSYMEQLTGKPRDELLQELTGVVFRVPGETTAAGEPLYQTGEEYLSGDVRKKLATAEIFAQQDPSYQVNVDSLRGVQPKDLTASEIELHLGTTWIPPEDIKQFILETMEPNRWAAQSIKVSYNRLNATWNIEGSSVDSYSLKATTTFGTKRKNFYEILRCSLNLQAVKVVDYIEDVDGKKKAVPNVKETRLAQDKQQQIETAFKDWIYRDPVRRRRLVDYYNTHYNNLRPREYDGSFLRFPGMNPEISLRPHQRNVVARILFGGNTLVAHSVGAGKTMVMGAAAMEKKRLGLCNKTLIIVPNHLTEQMGSELLSLYPNANILVSTRHDFEKNRRKLFCSRIATGNYDIVIMGHSQFSRIPLSSERQQKFLQDEIERYTQEIASAKKEKSGQDLSVKQMEATKKRLQSHLEELMDSPKDDVVTFEQLGVDSLMVDEAHEFKNLAVTTKMQNVAGISTSESQKATDLLMKTQYLDEITGGRGLVFCTGTPISNSPVELYTMMRYLQASTLRAHDLLSFDAWAANFGQTTTSIELAPEGTGYRSKTRFSRFFNLPELISMWKLATDVQTSDMLNLKVPDLEGGKATAVMCPPTELQKESIQALGERAEKVRAGNVDPHTDNMLKITTDGRKLALDQRLLNPLLPDVPENKATACASKVFEIWQNTMATQSTQLIFSDLATPSTGEWNVYDDIRDKLIAKGIPKEQIAFIHDANTDAKKATLFAKVRAGKVRILMGSTQKMGAGTNVQTKLIALHHLDVPWRPSDIEQREGRILRQGNENPSVQIYRYATEGSFDAYSWQLIENKQKFISQIMTSKSPARSCQDLDEVALSYAEIKALCAGNPLIKEKMELDNEVARLSTLRSSHMSQIFELQDKIAIGYPASIQKVEESLDAVSKDIDVYRANSRFNPDGSEKFSAIVMGTTYTERKAADAALRDALQGATAGDVIIGQYRGFNIHAYYDAKAVSFMGYLQGEQKYNFEFNPKENFSSFRHLLEKLSDTQALDQERLTILNKNLEDAKEAVNQPFAYEKEFQTKLARLNELNTVLNQEGGRTDMHPEIQALLTKIGQTYTAMVTDPQKYLDYLTFRGQCVGMGAENSVAVFAQNPKATYCPAPEAIGSPKVKPGEEDHFVSVLRSDGIERVYALEQYDLPESEYLDNAPLQWTDAQHGDLMHRVEDAAHLADIPIVKDIRHGPGFFDAPRNTIHIREGESDTEQLKSLLEGYSEAVIARTSTVERPVAELESAALAALLQVRCGVPVDGQLSERITTALEDARQVSGFSMKDSVARLHNAMEYCVRYAELEQTSEQYHAQQIEPEAMTPQSEAFMEMM